MWENTDQNNFKYGKILQNEIFSETVDLDLQLSIKWSPWQSFSCEFYETLQCGYSIQHLCVAAIKRLRKGNNCIKIEIIIRNLLKQTLHKK